MNDIAQIFNLWLPSPLQKLSKKEKDLYDLQVYVKRDDLIHHHISGNKYRKLKYNLEAFQKGNYDHIIGFGGVFSNLMYTLSHICKEKQIPTILYLRGDNIDSNNPTVKKIQKNGVEIRLLSRSEFNQKYHPDFISRLKKENPYAYIVPEGGSNALSVPGSAEIVYEIIEQLGFSPDYIIQDIATGGTFAGVLQSIPAETKLVGISVIKGVDWNKTLAKIYGDDPSPIRKSNYEIMEDYHFGGFAKHNQTLVDFINDYTARYGIPLDPIYTGKLVFGFMDLMKKGYFKSGSTVVWIHAGGLQGIDGFNYRYGNQIY